MAPYSHGQRPHHIGTAHRPKRKCSSARFYSCQFVPITVPLSLSQLTISTACSQCSLFLFSLTPFFSSHPHVKPPAMYHPDANPPCLCLLGIQFPPVRIFLHLVSESPLQSPFPISCFHLGCYSHSILFRIFTLSTANTAQVCNKFQLTHFSFFPSIYPDAFYQFRPQGIICPLLGPYKTVEVTVFQSCLPIYLQHLWSSGHYTA